MREVLQQFPQYKEHQVALILGMIARRQDLLDPAWNPDALAEVMAQLVRLSAHLSFRL